MRGDALDVPQTTIPELFQRLLVKDGGHFKHCPALIHNGRALTFLEVDELSYTWSCRLKAILKDTSQRYAKPGIAGNHPDHNGEGLEITQPVIGVFMPPCPGRITALLAVLR